MGCLEHQIPHKNPKPWNHDKSIRRKQKLWIHFHINGNNPGEMETAWQESNQKSMSLYTSEWIQTKKTTPLRFSKDENKKEHIPSIQQEWKQKRLYPFALAGMKTNKEFIPSIQQEWKQKRLYPFALAGMKTNKEFIPSSQQEWKQIKNLSLQSSRNENKVKNLLSLWQKSWRNRNTPLLQA